RNVGRSKRGHHAVFALDGVGGREQLPGRLAPQHVRPTSGVDLVRRIGLAALELLDRDRPGEAPNARTQEAPDRAAVEPVRGGDRPRAEKIVHAHQVAVTPPSTATICPVMKPHASDASNAVMPFKSSGPPTRFIGAWSAMPGPNCSRMPLVIFVGKNP